MVNNLVEKGLWMLAALAVMTVLVGAYSGRWRLALRLFFFGVGFLTVELVVIAFAPAVGTFIAEVSR